MDTKDALILRRSIREYKPEPVSKEVLKDILELAVQSPSALNAQPWEFTVVTGDILEKIKKANVDLLSSGEQARPDIPFEAL
jgi:nitroreductase